MDVPRAPDSEPPEDGSAQPLITSPPSSIRLRRYTDEQLRAFTRADTLDGEALRIARRFARATGLGFFQDAEPDDAPDADRQS